jgi:signal peptide peptidase SppA
MQDRNNKLVRVLTALHTEAWLLPPSVHAKLVAIAEAHASGGDIEAAQHALAAGMQSESKREYAMHGDVAVIPVEGVIGRKYSSSLHSSGVTSVDVLQRLIESATADPRVSALVLSIDSPGGLARGVPEAARAVSAANTSKPVIAYVDGQACSAAYWIASQASAIYATESASVGSIGVYSSFLDASAAVAAAGCRVDLFKSGKFKGMGLEGTSLTDEARELIQKSVDDLGVQFRAAVRSGRARDISDDVMQGQSFDVAEAQANGLIDGTSTLAKAVADASRLAVIRRGGR